jgi:DNA-directed RNA polymerase subunit K/omega
MIGPPILTKYEMAKVLGVRITQLSLGAPTAIELDPDQQYTLQEIAHLELTSKCMPVKVVRRMKGEEHIIDTNQLELTDH